MKESRGSCGRQKTPEVLLQFRRLELPFDVARIVNEALASTQPKYLSGLRVVVLRDVASLTRRERRSFFVSGDGRGRVGQSRGLYYAAFGHTPARIELFVDNILGEWKPWLLRVTFLRKAILARVLFHELGHHIDAVVEPKKRTEASANRWSRRLTLEYLRKHHRYCYLAAAFAARLAGLKPRRRREPKGT